MWQVRAGSVEALMKNEPGTQPMPAASLQGYQTAHNPTGSFTVIQPILDNEKGYFFLTLKGLFSPTSRVWIIDFPSIYFIFTSVMKHQWELNFDILASLNVASFFRHFSCSSFQVLWVRSSYIWRRHVHLCPCQCFFLLTPSCSYCAPVLSYSLWSQSSFSNAHSSFFLFLTLFPSILPVFSLHTFFFFFSSSSPFISVSTWWTEI